MFFDDLTQRRKINAKSWTNCNGCAMSRNLYTFLNLYSLKREG